MTAPAPEFVVDPHRPIAAQVHGQLKRAIITARLRSGQALSEKELSARFGVSRTPCREALIRLAEEGLVVIYAQRGTVVAPIDPDGVAQAQFIREALEVAVVNELANQSREVSLAGLKMLLRDQRRAAAARQYETLFELDDAFHRDLCGLAGRQPVWPLVAGVKMQMDRVRYLSLPDPLRINEILGEHAAIVAAIEQRDGARAEGAMRRHLRAVLQSIATVGAADDALFK